MAALQLPGLSAPMSSAQSQDGEISEFGSSAWTSGFAPLQKSNAWLEGTKRDMEDKWEFEADTYTLGILNIVKRGLPGGALHLCLGFATPVIQLAAFFKIYEHIISEPKDFDEKLHPSCSLYVRLICFILMALQLSNEALEGFQKLVFALRCLSGVYKDVKGPTFVAAFLGMMQFGMAVGTVGLSMLVVSVQTTALDAFMNFVALAFLTEIDNILISSRTVQNFVSVETEYTAAIVPNSLEETDRTHWPVGMMLASNALVALAWCVNVAIFYLTAEMAPEMESLDIRGHLLSVSMCWITWNLMMWCGSRRVGAMYCGRLILFVGWAFDIADKAYLYSTHRRLFSPLSMSVIYWFEMAMPVSAFAVEHDVFNFLRCPIRAPMLVWSMLIQSVFMFDTLYRFGLD